MISLEYKMMSPQIRVETGDADHASKSFFFDLRILFLSLAQGSRYKTDWFSEPSGILWESTAPRP